MVTCDLPKAFLPKKCQIVQFADDNLPTHNLPKEMTFLANFQFLYSKKVLNHNLPTYYLPKRRSNDANIILTTCNDRHYWRDGRAKVCDRREHRPTLRPRAICRFFVQFADSANRDWTNQASADRYAPHLLYLKIFNQFNLTARKEKCNSFSY